MIDPFDLFLEEYIEDEEKCECIFSYIPSIDSSLDISEESEYEDLEDEIEDIDF